MRRMIGDFAEGERIFVIGKAHEICKLEKRLRKEILFTFADEAKYNPDRAYALFLPYNHETYGFQGATVSRADEALLYGNNIRTLNYYSWRV